MANPSRQCRLIIITRSIRRVHLRLVAEMEEYTNSRVREVLQGDGACREVTKGWVVGMVVVDT